VGCLEGVYPPGLGSGEENFEILSLEKLYFGAFSCTFKLSVNVLQLTEITTETHSHFTIVIPMKRMMNEYIDNDSSQ